MLELTGQGFSSDDDFRVHGHRCVEGKVHRAGAKREIGRTREGSE